MNFKILIGILIIAVLVAGCVGPPVLSPGTGEATVKVLDASSGNPLEGVEVNLISVTSNQQTFNQFTDASGETTFEVDPDTYYAVAYDANTTNKVNSNEFNISEGQTTNVEIALG